MDKAAYYFNLIQEELQKLNLDQQPATLYQPMEYALTLGGKRIRPILTLMACDMFDRNIADAIPAALAIEIFHNFTLVHDDIMDDAPLRRGMPTVYKKWNSNVAILSGDALFAKAFEIMAQSDERQMKKLMGVLSKVAVEVCEGQQLDMDFERANHISMDDYLLMIELKTAVLLGAALELGGIVADCNQSDLNELYVFGKHLGMAFQIKDDLLDIFGEAEKFGKIVGNDIITRKKTFLYQCALSSSKQTDEFKETFFNTEISDKVRVGKVIGFYHQFNVITQAENKMESYYQQAVLALQKIQVPEENKRDLYQLAEKLMYRDK